MSIFAVEYDANDYMSTALAPVQAERKRVIMEDTWGHLAPEKHISYSGFMVFTLGAWGDWTPIQARFKALPDSPWFFDDMMDFIEKRAKKEGTVYRFDGTYRNHRFTGKVSRVKV